MLISENALNILTACEYRGIGKAWINHNLCNGGDVDTIVSQLEPKIPSVTVYDFETKKQRIRTEIEWLGDAIDGVVGLGDEDFPTISSEVKESDRPIALFYRGDIKLIKTTANNVAVIGLLNPTSEIEENEKQVVRELVKHGKCIISGLANGCDSVGHRETLACGGKTVAFLSSQLTKINPPANRPLAEEIVEKGGLLVSEYFRDVYTKREFISRYPERDRLQAMFVESIVLSASYAQYDYGYDSGSRYAMGKAAEYGIPRYVIYDKVENVGDPMFNLSRDEIATGAIVIDPKEISTSPVINSKAMPQQLELSFM